MNRWSCGSACHFVRLKHLGTLIKKWKADGKSPKSPASSTQHIGDSDKGDSVIKYSAVKDSDIKY